MKQTFQLGALSAANIALGLAFQWIVFTHLGPGVETDALFAGMTIPLLVLSVVNGSLTHVLVPLLAGNNQDRIHRDTWSFLVLISVLFTVLSTILYVSSPWWVPLTVPGFSQEGKALTIHLSQIQLLAMVFTGTTSVQSAAYHARQKFIWAETVPFLANLLTLLLLVLALPRYGVSAAAWLSVFRMATQTILLSPCLYGKINPDLKSQSIKLAWTRIKPLMLGTAFYKTDTLVDRYLLSSVSSGGLSLYYLAQQIYGAASQIINRALATPLVPTLSNLHKKGDSSGFKKLYHRRMIQVGLLSILGILTFVFFGRLILSPLVEYGKLSFANLELLWLIMLLMVGQFAIGNLGMIMTSMLYSVGDTRLPTLSGAISYIIGTFIKIVLFNLLGLPGLALGVTTYYLVSLIIMSFKMAQMKYA